MAPNVQFNAHLAHTVLAVSASSVANSAVSALLPSSAQSASLATTDWPELANPSVHLPPLPLAANALHAKSLVLLALEQPPTAPAANQATSCSRTTASPSASLAPTSSTTTVCPAVVTASLARVLPPTALPVQAKCIWWTINAKQSAPTPW